MTSHSVSVNGKERSSAALMMLKIAVLAPIPKARVMVVIKLEREFSATFARRSPGLAKISASLLS
jgi:hypothetical protein